LQDDQSEDLTEATILLQRLQIDLIGRQKEHVVAVPTIWAPSPPSRSGPLT
jgi:hypothetical protein